MTATLPTLPAPRRRSATRRPIVSPRCCRPTWLTRVATASIVWALAGSTLRAQSTAPAGETDARARLVVTPAWLAAHATDANLVVLDIGDESDYLAGHIPGARHVELESVTANADMKGMDPNDRRLMVEMLPPAELDARLAALGITNQSRIVVYPSKDWLTGATRVLFTLAYAGLGAQSSILDGGLAAWRRQGHPVTQAVPPPVKLHGELTVTAQPNLIVNAVWVRQHLVAPGVRIIDARATTFYDGTGMGESRRGHIHGAGSVPFTSVVDDSLELLKPEALAALFRAASVGPNDTVVAYCHIGLQATAVILAAETLGHPVRLYDGSFQDWSQQPELPVDDPSGKGPKK